MAKKLPWFKIYAILSVVLLTSATLRILSILKTRHSTESPTRSISMMDGIGVVHHPVSTHIAQVQEFFDQGLALCYGFDKPNAVVSFQQAERLDPSLAMAFWGEAYALGPDINHAPSKTERARALVAIHKAMDLASHASQPEKDYIDALSKRFPLGGKATDVQLDHAYADAMRDVSAHYPDDLDAAVLYAESLMDLSPWRLWTDDGNPTPGSEPIIPVLESVLQRDPDNLGANHFYVHALEGSPHPDKALAAALKLPKLAPKSPHLVHMPSHILIHTGGYFEAVQANLNASALGESNFLCCGPPVTSDFDYQGHNLKFLIYAAEMAGMSTEATNAAKRLQSLVNSEEGKAYLGTPDIEFIGYDSMVLSRFEKWSEILALPAPSQSSSYAANRYHFARALAFATQNDYSSANKECSAIEGADRSAGSTTRPTRLATEAAILVEIANGRIARAKGNYPNAVRHFTAAVKSQDDAGYREPPLGPWPAREELGAALLAMGNWADAEKAYRQNLLQFPGSGRTLCGLEQSLRHQGKVAEADAIEIQLREAWKHADVPLNPAEF